MAIVVLFLALFLMPLQGEYPGPAYPDTAPREPVVAGEAGPAPTPVDPGPSFTENMGQFGPWSARFYAIGGPWSVALGDGWVVYDLHAQDPAVASGGTVVRVTFAGAREVVPVGSGTLRQRSNYLHGKDPALWVTDVPHYRSVLYSDLWDGIDLELRFEGSEFKYEFTVAPGSDPSCIVMAYEGMDVLEVCDDGGDLLVRTPAATLRDSAPVTYQDVEGWRIPVASSFKLAGDDRVDFRVGDYDPGLPLVIDPGMVFSTFLGAGGDEAGEAVAVDGEGHVYVAGRTSSAAFPLTPGAYNSSLGGYEAFVARFSPNGSVLEYSTFIGGSNDDEAVGVAVDDGGRVHLAGTTASSDFPTTAGAFCTALTGDNDAFTLRLDTDGSNLEYSTYIGGHWEEGATALWLGADGSVYVSGWTFSFDFPSVEGSFRKMGNKSDDTEEEDAFIVKVSPDGSKLVYSCVLGGDLSDRANALYVDDAGCAYVTGETASEEFPTTPGAFQLVIGSTEEMPDVFLTKLDATGRSLVRSTFIGDMGADRGLGIDVDGQGCMYIVGVTTSGKFPEVPHVSEPRDFRAPDSFILKLDNDWHHIIYSKVLNVTYVDEAVSVAVDKEGCVNVVGHANGNSNFPADPNAIQSQGHGWNEEAYILRVDAVGDRILYASLLGGDGDDRGLALAVDDDGLLYVTGRTSSAKGFPTTPGAYDVTPDMSTSGGASGDAFVCKLDISIPYLVNDSSPSRATTGDPYTFNLTVSDNGRVAEVRLEYGFGGVVNGTVLPLALSSGDDRNGSWTATIDVPYDSLAPLFYRAWAEDNVGLNATLADWSVLVVDNDPPELEGLAPTQGGTGDELVLTVRVTDNICVGDVAVLFEPGGLPGSIEEPWVESGPTPGSANDTYEFTVVLPRFANGTLRYMFWANDTSGNWCATAVIELEVVDNDGLHIMVEPLPAEVTTGQDVLLRVHARDNIGVASVEFTWWYDQVPEPVRVTLPMAAGSVDQQGNGPYTGTLSVPFENVYGQVLPVRLMFVAMDLADNEVSTRAFVLRVRDDDPPWLLGYLSAGEATTGDPFGLTVRVWDNIALGDVRVRYWYDEGPVHDRPLVRGDGDVWNATITIPHQWTALHYTIYAMDTSGNVNWSRQWDIPVTDNDPPRVEGDYTGDVATTGGTLLFHFRVEDNLYVRSARVVYTTGDGRRYDIELVAIGYDAKRNGFYQALVWVLPDASGPLTYTVVATDAAGNTFTTEERHIQVLDDDPPWFGDDLSDPRAWRGGTFNMGVEVADNVAVIGLWCEWWFGDGERCNESVPLDAVLAIDVPLAPMGELRYRFAARDAEGNWARSSAFRREPQHAPPRFEGLDVWNVTEGLDEHLDLRGFIDGLEDEGWSLSLEGSHVTLEGYVLRAWYDVWVFDHAVELSVIDGRDVTRHNITVHIIAVNDPPRIEEVLYNGAPFDSARGTASFREGRNDVLTVQAWDEEGDPMTFTWSKDGEVVVTGSELRYGDLTLGTYGLTLEVDDGTDATSYTLTVTVSAVVEPFPSLNLAVVVLVIAVVASVVIVVRWSVRRRG